MYYYWEHESLDLERADIDGKERLTANKWVAEQKLERTEADER